MACLCKVLLLIALRFGLQRLAFLFVIRFLVHMNYRSLQEISSKRLRSEYSQGLQYVSSWR